MPKLRFWDMNINEILTWVIPCQVNNNKNIMTFMDLDKIGINVVWDEVVFQYDIQDCLWASFLWNSFIILELNFAINAILLIHCLI